MHSRSRHPQAAALSYRDACCSPVQAKHIAVDGVARKHKAGKAAVLIDLHLGDGGLEAVLHLTREADLHRCAQRLAVLTQQLFALLCSAHAHIAPCEPCHDLTGAAVQCQHWVGLQIALQLLCVQCKDIIGTGIEPSAAGRAHKIAGLRCSDLRRAAQLRLHALGLLDQRGDLIGKVCSFARYHPELVLGQQVGIGIIIHRFIIAVVQRIQQVIQRRRTFF